MLSLQSKVSPHFNLKKTTRLFPLCNPAPKDAFSIFSLTDAISLIFKQNVMQTHHSVKSAIKKSWIRLYMHSHKQPLRENAWGY
jgi:hypothetical protein